MAAPSLQKTTSARSVPEMFLDRVAATPDNLAFQRPSASGWDSFTWKQTGDRVRLISAGLKALGLKPEERCAILSGTRLDWVLADLGILCAGGATTTIYPSSTADDCAFILQDSGTVFVFVENAEQAAKLAGKRAELPAVKKLIVFDGPSGQDGWVQSLADLEALGRDADAKAPGKFVEDARAVRPEMLATLIYTSGTTGRPKGVELTHDCWVYEGEAIEDLGILHHDDLQFLWLPLAHSFGKVLEAAQLRIGFGTAIDGRLEKLTENLKTIRPTFSSAVPRIFEKVHAKVLTGAQEKGGLALQIFNWAFGVGRKVSKLRQVGKEPGGLLGLQFAVADKLVFSKLRAIFGGRLRFFISGSAPLNRDIAEFFHAMGILVLEGYGLTETSAFSFVNRPDKFRFGSVGTAAKGTQLKIAEDGEILIKGRGVMRGYKGLGDATRETIDADHWLHSGDIGELDPDGFLRITDRKKDLIKTSGGKYVAPQNIEGKLKLLCPLIAHVVVHGDNRNFCSALIGLEDEGLRKWARENGVPDAPYAEVVKNEKVHGYIKGFVDQLNKSLASYESIKKFALLPAELTENSGDLTPSMKLKRKAVEKKYKAMLDEFYA